MGRADRFQALSIAGSGIGQKAQASVDGTRKHAGQPTVIDENDRVMLPPAVSAKEGRVQASVGILWVKALTVECDPPVCRIA